MSKILNNFFCSVFTIEDTVNLPKLESISINKSISGVYFTEEQITKKVLGLKPTSSAGPDHISSKILKENIEALSAPLTKIFNKSIQTSEVPSDWRIANVTPIHKKGSKSPPEHYRPISLTSIAGKVMESIIRDEIVDHLSTAKLINGTQHGFMKNKSCATNLLEFLERITSEHDRGNATDIIYLDFSKAFDKVPKKRLIIALKAHGINGPLLQWIENWLTNRKQRVVLNGSFSEWLDVLSGVPQGSVLGPLLFLIYINSIDAAAGDISILAKFADDTKIGQVILSQQDQVTLQTCLNNLMHWAEKWGMEFNITKCKVLHVGKNNPLYPYTMNDQELKSVDNEKDIGVIVDKTLKPTKQCADAARKANAVLGQISRAFHYRDKHTFLKLYMQFVRCHLEFSITAWNPWTVQDIDVLERVQKRAINMISGLQGKSYSEKLSELNLQSLEDRRTRFDMLQTFKILKRIDNVNPDTWFTTMGTGRRVTRLSANPLNLIKQRSRTDVRQNFFSQRVVDKWNQLPDFVKDSTNITRFKKNYDYHCTGNAEFIILPGIVQ